MKTLLLTPNDVLFFRDGRPMTGSLIGHGAAWCPPHLISHAFRASFHRANLPSHSHRTKGTEQRDQKYGSLITAGPFPVDAQGNWFFPAPLDLFKTADGRVALGLRPVANAGSNSLPKPLTCMLGMTLPPNKDSMPGHWLSAAGWRKYLSGQIDQIGADEFRQDGDIGDLEANIGIGMDDETHTQDGERIYSAQYLRLVDGWKLGTTVSAYDKDYPDLVDQLFPEQNKIVIGGQQRVCQVETSPEEFPLPQVNVDYASGQVKWVLLSPAVFPEIADGSGANPGGWLPNWVDAASGQVMLKKATPRGDREPRLAWRERVKNAPFIAAHLVAAKIGNALPVSGWSLKDNGAKPTQLAVPAGSIYYFQCDTPEAAQELAQVLNYPNRRSTLWGEKGYGIGICTAF